MLRMQDFPPFQLYCDSVLLVEETGGPGKTTDLSQFTDTLNQILLFTSPWSRFELTTSMVMGTDCIGSYKSNYYTITPTCLVETNNLVLCSSCSGPTNFRNLQMWCRERGTPQTRCLLWFTICFPHYNAITTIERTPLLRHQERAEELWGLEPPSRVPNNGL